MRRRIGIFSGTFDPVHAGHIAAALAAAKAAHLDKVYFAPEAQPRRKSGFVHYAHRVALLRLATSAHPDLCVIELPDKRFTISQTLPRLRQIFVDSDLVYICGSDMVRHMDQWPLIGSLFRLAELAVILRAEDTAEMVNKWLRGYTPTDASVSLVPPVKAEYSSSGIRQALAHGQPAPGLLPSTQKYITRNWLYSFPGPPTLS